MMFPYLILDQTDTLRSSEVALARRCLESVAFAQRIEGVMKRSCIHALLCCISIALLSACGSSTSSTASGANLVPQGKTSAVPLTITLHVPTLSTQSIARNKEYISPATASAQLSATAVNGTTTTTIANCTTTCMLSTQMAPGQVQLSVNLYAGANATGALLSSGSLNTTIAQNAQNALSISLGGVIAALALNLSTTSFTLGSSSTSTVNVVPLDASGNQIIGNQAFTTPITLSLSNNSANEFSLGTTSISSPAGDSIPLTFNGGLTAENPTISATINGTTISASASISTHSAIVLPTVTAVSAKTFVNSIGVNTHVNYPAYANAFPTFASLLTASGIRHIRDGFVSNPASAFVYFGYLQQLQSNGIRATMETSINMPTSTILANTQAVPNFTEAIEGPNEYDISGDPNWATNLASYQQTLYAGVKSTSGLSSLPVIGPALTSAASYATVGNLSAYMDEGNMHDYFAGYNPGTTGYGGGGFGSVYGTIAYNQGEAAQTSGTKPIVATETGYCTVANTRNAVTPAIESKYIPRMFLEQWLANVTRTIEYEFIDEGGGGCNATYGLVTSSLTPKPGYYALQSFIQTINDTGSSTTTTPLPMSLTSSATTLHHLLLQKSNGTYVLALWNEVQSWNVNNGTGTAVTPTPVTLTLQLATTPSNSNLQTISDSGTLQTGSLAWNNGVVVLSVDDHVTLVTLSP